MMRVGIIAFGSGGDVQPYVALGKGLKQASYEVILLTKNAAKGPALERRGWIAAPRSGHFRFCLRQSEEIHSTLTT